MSLAVARTRMPTGVAAMWRTSSRVPRLWWPAGMRFSTASSAAASIRLIITGVASTWTRPEPMRGAVCSLAHDQLGMAFEAGFQFRQVGHECLFFAKTPHHDALRGH